MGIRSRCFFILNAFWIEFWLGSGLDVLVLKNDAECTSQRLKRTSEARVLFLFFGYWLLLIGYWLLAVGY